MISGDGQDELLENFNNSKVFQKELEESQVNLPSPVSQRTILQEDRRKVLVDLQFRGKE